jgi:alpha-tubulin suppressor-like RCC1 family protein
MRMSMKSMARSVLATVVGSAFVVGCGGQGEQTAPAPSAIGQVDQAVSRSSPQMLTGVSGVTKVVGGNGHAFAVTSTGSYGWGFNAFGQTGIGTNSPSSFAAPTAVHSSISSAVDFAGGRAWYAVALTSGGDVYTFGTNFDGQLGNGTTNPSTIPVLALTNATAIAAGTTHTLALKSDGTLWAWGHNAAGELGDGTNTGRLSPVQVTGLSGVTITDIAAGSDRSYALDSNGNVWAWGYQTAPNGNPYNVPTLVPGLSSAVAISANQARALIVKSDGTVWELGLRGAVSQVMGLSSTIITAVAAGDGHSLALSQTGEIWSWGNNSSGQLGDGTTTSSATPVQLSLTGVVAVGAASSSSFAVLNDGSLWSWGDDSNSVLGQ